MPDIPPNLQAVLVSIISLLGGWLASRATEKGKARELAKDAQGQFMQTVLEEMDELKAENKELRRELEELRDEVRALRAEKHTLTRELDNMARVMGRVGRCPMQGCPHAARAAEFGGNQ